MWCFGPLTAERAVLRVYDGLKSAVYLLLEDLSGHNSARELKVSFIHNDLEEAVNRRELGRQGLEVSALGLGCMGMSAAYGTAETRDEEQSIATINRALELGITFFDTADAYGPHENERLLGRALKGRRDEVELATKFGLVSDEPERGIDGRPERVAVCCDGSLKRLGFDVIDLYYLHRVDPRVPIEETVGAMADLVTAGKVRYIGLSEVSGDTLRRAHAVHPITAVQSEYSLWTRDPEATLIPALRELGVGLVAYSPLGRGFLTGSIRSTADLPEGDWRRMNPRFAEDHIAANLNFVSKVKEIASAKEIMPAQLALAWVISRYPGVVPIPGTTNPGRLAENAASVDVQLTDDDLRQIDAAFPADAAVGDRYPKASMGYVNA